MVVELTYCSLLCYYFGFIMNWFGVFCGVVVWFCWVGLLGFLLLAVIVFPIVDLDLILLHMY